MHPYRLGAVGTSTAQPHDIVAGTSAGKTDTTGQTLTVTYDDLVDLKYSVDTIFRTAPGCSFMMHD